MASDLWGQIQANNKLAKNQAGLAANAAQAAQGYKGYGMTPGQGGYQAPQAATSPPGQPSSRWARLAQVGAQKIQSLEHPVGRALAAAGRFVGTGVAKGVNTAVEGARQTGYTAEMIAANKTHNAKAFQNANAASQANYEQANKPNAGILNVGTFFKNGREAQSGKISTVSKRVGGGMLEVAGDVLPGAEIGKASKVYKAGKGLVKGTESLGSKVIKQGATGAVAGAAGSAGSQLVNNGKVDVKETAKSTAAGAALGAAIPAVAKAGSFAIQKGKMLFNREATKAAEAAKNANPGVINDEQAQHLTSSKQINVTDKSSTVKGKVSNTVPTGNNSQVPTERPSSKGYSDTDFRLQFNKGAKSVVEKNPNKFTYLDEKFNKSEDPITQVVGTLSHTSSKSTIRDAVTHLLPELDSTTKNRLVRDIGNAKSHQEVADHLWDAAKNHESTVSATGTTAGKKISFSDNSEKVSEMGGSRPIAELQTKIEQAHNAGDKEETEKLIQQLPDASTRDAMRSSVGLQTKETKLVINPETKQTERVPIAKTGKNTLPVKSNGALTSSKLSQKIQAKAVENKLTEDLGQPQYHHTLNIKEQAQKAADLINKDEQRAIDVALGKRNAPSGVHPHAVFVAVEKKATQDGNTELITRLANSSRVDEATAAGQTLRVLRERDESSPVTALQRVIDARIKEVEKRSGQSSGAIISKTSRDIESNIKKPNRNDWHTFVESIKC